MPKKEVKAKIIQSFAKYFKETGDTSQFKWLGSADEDVNVDEDIPHEAGNVVLKNLSQLKSTKASVDHVLPENCAVVTANHNSDDATIQNISHQDKEFDDLVGGQVESDKIEVSRCRPEASTASIDSQNERPYDILQDAQNPMVFHVCPKKPDSEIPFNRRMIRLRGESIIYDGSELRRCFIPLKDFRKRYRKPNPLENMKFFAARPAKQLRKTRKNQRRPPKVSKKQGKAVQRTLQTQIRDDKVEQRPSLWDAIQEAYPKPPTEIPQLALTKQVVQSDNNEDVDELFQYASMPTLSDVEDVEYQLSLFLNFTNNIVETSVQVDQHLTDTVTQNAAHEFPQPLDLSMKKVTPMSTDTGFCNGSSSMDVTSAYQFSLLPTQAYHSATENRIEFTNDYAEKSRAVEAENWQPSTTRNLDPTMKLPSNTTTTQPIEKELCDVEPRFEVPSDAKATALVTMPPETNLAPKVGNTRQVWNTDSDSTDLDYEPSEDEPSGDDLSDDCHIIQSTTTSVNNDNTTPVEPDNIPQVPDDLAPVVTDTTQPVEPCIESHDNNVIEAASNPRTTRSAAHVLLSKSVESKEITSTNVKVVEQQQTAPVLTDSTQPVEPCIESHEKNVIEAASNPRTNRSTVHALVSKSVESKEITSANVNVVEQQQTAVEKAKPMTILKKVPFTKRMVKPPPEDLLKPAGKDKIELLKAQVDYLLNRICLNYLADETCTKSICRKNHNLPEADEMLVKLKLFPIEAILCIYSLFITRNRLAFINYFPTVCTIFGERKLKSQLIAAVTHCDQHNKQSFYSDIYSACVRLGMFKLKAMSEIAKMSCKCAISCTYILNILVKEDPEIFKPMLKDFYPLANVDSQHVLALLRHLYENPEPSLLKLSVDIFDKYSRSDISDFGPYNMIYHDILSLVNDCPNLVQKLECIAVRDKRLP